MPTFSTGQEVIKEFMRSLDNTTLKGQAALDQAVRACSNFGSISDLINNFISDCQNAASGSAFLKNYCGIDLDNQDTGAISGYDAGGSTVKTAESIVPEYGNGYNFTGTSFTKKGLTVTVPTQSSMNGQQKTIVNGLYNWWIEQSLNLIEESYGSNFGFSSSSSATTKDMNFYFVNSSSSGALATTWTTQSTSTGNLTNLEMNVNTYYCSSFTDSINGDPGNGQEYLDRTIAHEMTHAAMAANVKFFHQLPQFIKEGMAELTHGIDDARTSTINKLANNPTALRASVNIDDTGTGTSDCYAGGYMLLRYLAKQASNPSGPETYDNSIVNSKSNTIVYGTADAESILNETGGSRATIIAGAGDDTIDNRGDYAVINGGAGNDSINSSRNTTYGWYATINGGLGNDTITGSTHPDVFQYSVGDGNDVITNYSASDSIQINSGTVGSTVASGNDVIVNIGSGSIKLKNAVGIALNLVDGNGNAITVGGVTPVSKIIDNTTPNSIVSGTAYDDTIKNSAGGAKIYGGNGNDSIYNSTSGSYTINNAYGYVTIDGGAGDDTVTSNDPNLSINGGAGNDSINVGDWANITIRGGTGNDVMRSSSRGVWYQYANGDGNDSVTNYNSNDTIQITSGTVNSTQLSGSDVIVSIGSGSIRLVNATSKILNLVDANRRAITLGGDSSVGSIIFNESTNTIVNGTSGKDTIRNTGGGVKINAGSGNDSIYSSTNNTINNSYGYVTIDAGAGDDTVDSHDPYVSINGGAGNDQIKLGTWNHITVRGGTGNDSISGDGNYKLYQYASGDGNDSIANYNGTDTIQITSGTVNKTVASGSDLIIAVGTGSIRLIDVSSANLNLVDAYGNKISIGSSGGDTTSIIENTTRYSVVGGRSGNDTIKNSAGGATLLGGSGNDSIYNSTSSSYTINNAYGYVTIDGGSGNDIINNYDPRVSINGGSGNDSIRLGGWKNITVRGGTGNDTISNLGSNNVIQYQSGDGNDVIQGFNSTSTLKITDESSYSTSIDDNDVIVSIGSGSVRLKDAVGMTLNIDGRQASTIQTANSIDNTVKNTIVSGSGGNDTIRNRAGGVSIFGGDGGDSIYSNLSSSYTINGSWGYVTIDGGKGDDTIYNNDPRVSINGGEGNDSIYENGNSLVTMRGGAGNDTIRMSGAKNVIEYANGDGGDLVYGVRSDTTIHILDESEYSTIESGSDVILSIEDGAITLKNASGIDFNVVGGISGEEENDKVLFNYTPETIFSGTSGKDTLKNYAGGVTIKAGNGNDSIYSSTNSDYTVNSSYGYVTIDSGAGNDTINSNDPYVSVNGGAGNDSIEVSGWRHVTVRGGTGNDTITNVGDYNLIEYASGDGRDVVFDFDEDDTIRVVDGASYSTLTNGNDVIVSIGSGSITLKDAAEMSINIVGSLDTLDTQTANFIENTIKNTLVNGTSDDDTISNSAGGVTIKAGAGDDSIISSTSSMYTVNNSYGYVTIDAGAGDDTVENIDPYVSISGGAGDDFIYNNTWRNVTINGGTGDDTIDGLGSNNVIQYKAGDGDDVIVDFDESATIRIMDSSQYSTLTIGDDLIVSLASGSITLKDAADIDLNISGGSTINYINNTRSNVKVIGTSGADSITSSGKNVTISGGAGNDTITGSSNAEVIAVNYLSGKDVVTNFGVNDTLRNTGGTMAYKKSGTNYIVSIKKNSTTATVTLQGAAEHLKLKKSGSLLTTDGVYYITNSKSKVKVTGTSGKDSITSTGKNVTLVGGKGNDTLTGSKYGDVFSFAYNHGKDVITNFDANDTLKITSGTIKSYAASGSDYIIKVTNGSTTGTVTLKDAVDNITLKKSGSTVTAKSSSAELPSGAEQYWFEEQDSAIDDPINEIMSEDAAVDLQFDQLTEALKPISAIELASSARKRQSKK